MRDTDIRVGLKKTYLKKFLLDDNSRVIEELDVCYGFARIDIAVINGSIKGYEIKSDLDTLKRLPNQIKMYQQVFEYLTIIAGESHIEKVLNDIPEWCGVILAKDGKRENSVILSEIRRSKKNLYTESISVAQLLWREEAIQCLNEIGIMKGLSSKPKPFLWNLLAESVDKQRLSQLVIDKLKSRANWRVGQ